MYGIRWNVGDHAGARHVRDRVRLTCREGYLTMCDIGTLGMWLSLYAALDTINTRMQECC